jgi:uncharacterized membrane protein YebE (DUF533 family)
MATDDAILDILGPPPGDVAATIPSKVLETILIRFLARVVHADGTIHPKELSSLVDIAIKLELGGDEARRILDDELAKKSDVATLAAQLPDEQSRREAYAMGCVIGFSDGSVGDTERTVLAEFARGAGIAPDDAERVLGKIIEAMKAAQASA